MSPLSGFQSARAAPLRVVPVRPDPYGDFHTIPRFLILGGRGTPGVTGNAIMTIVIATTQMTTNVVNRQSPTTTESLMPPLLSVLAELDEVGLDRLAGFREGRFKAKLMRPDGSAHLLLDVLVDARKVAH